MNILSNAIIHTETGYVKIYNDKQTMFFENTGEEIKNEYKTKIFEPFFTIDKSKNRKTVGFGLGLSIVRNLSTNNNYEVALYSSNKHKTTFYLK
jgi:two-component system sensor histidine kinase SaeS